MIIEIDSNSGFCYGVRKAINIAENNLSEHDEILCFGEIIHNHEEINRLSSKGMITVGKQDIINVKGKTVLIRTHGEPPSTYSLLSENKNKIIDATCPVVLKLQKRIKSAYKSGTSCNGQIVLIGKLGHAEIIGLAGQTENKAIIVSSTKDLNQIDYSLPVEVFVQTTFPIETFILLSEEIQKRSENKAIIHDTICRQVSNRVPRITEFSKKFDIILFVSGKNSSNGKLLYDVCLKNNHQSFFITSLEDIEKEWFSKAERVGICGATSTPQWLMEKVAQHVRTFLNIIE